MENEIYVACCFESDKGIMMAGTKDAEGKINPIAVERRVGISEDSITNDVLTLNEETRKMFADLTQCVNNRLSNAYDSPMAIKGVYMGVKPRSMRSVKTINELTLETRRRVTENDINELRRGAYTDASLLGDVMVTYNCGYILNDTKMRHVIGESAKKLKMDNVSVVVNNRFSTDYKGLLPKNVSLLGVMPASVAVGNVVTTADERFDGVVSVHFCAKSTLFTAYVEDYVAATCVVPFGEDDVIHDLCSSVFRDNKLWRKVYEVWDFINGVSKVRIKDRAGATHSLDIENDNKMIAAAKMRIKEILKIGLDWIADQVECDYEKVIKNIVFTGTLADKAGFIDYESHAFPDSVCRRGDISEMLSNTDFADDNDYLPLIGLIQMASENCVDDVAPAIEVAPEPQKNTRKISIFTKAKDKVKVQGGILRFDDDETL